MNKLTIKIRKFFNKYITYFSRKKLIKFFFQLKMDKQLIGQGAEAKIYKATWLGKPVIIKERFPKKYRHPHLDAHLTNSRIKSEARCLARCQLIGVKTPTLYDVDLQNGIIIMEHQQNNISVKEYLLLSLEDCYKDIILNLGNKIGQQILKLHDNHIIHGDLTTSNMLLTVPVETSEICFIDFGLSYIDESSEEKAIDLYVLERAILSTHQNAQFLVDKILETYEINGGSSASSVIKKLNVVRLRGRKKLCFG